MRAARKRGFSGRLFAATLSGALILPAVLPISAAGLYLDPSTIPGRPLCSGTVDELTAAQPDSVHRMLLLEGQDATLGGPASIDGDTMGDIDDALEP
jgi:hypothetical protein